MGQKGKVVKPLNKQVRVGMFFARIHKHVIFVVSTKRS